MRRRRRVRAVLALIGLVAAGLAAVGPAGAPVAAAEEEAPAASGTFTALTYNVAGLPEPLSGSEPATNTPYISPLLNRYDLVLVQEDWANDPPLPPPLVVYHELLVAGAEHPYTSTPKPNPMLTNPARPMGVLSDGLNRLSRFPFGDLTRVMWPSCFGGPDTSDGGAADCLAEKGFSFARHEVAPGVEVDVYNLHAEAGNTPADQAARAEDYQVLAAFVTEHSAGRAVIVAGDYNLHTDRSPDAEVHRAFLDATGLTDVCELVDCGEDAHEIDKFAFRSGDTVKLQAITHRFERDVFVRPTDGAPLSDHDALAVTFAWERVEPTGTLTVTVTSASGTPVDGALVAAYRPEDGFEASHSASTVGGVARLTVTAGEYRVAVVPPAGLDAPIAWWPDAPDRTTAGPVPVPPGGEISLDVGLTTGGRLEGTVTTFDEELPAGEKPLEGATVLAFRPNDAWLGLAVTTTDADGEYALSVPGGEYLLLAIPPAGLGLPGMWFDGVTNRAAATLVPVTPGATARADIFVGGRPSIRGWVVDPEGNPVPGAIVWAYRPTDSWVGSAATTTDADGLFVLRQLEWRETYKLRVVPPAGSGLRTIWYQDAATRTDATPVTVSHPFSNQIGTITLPAS